MKTIEKRPGETTLIAIDYSEFLAANDEIASMEWAAHADLTIGNETNTADAAQAFVSGGTAHSTYFVTITMTSLQGRIKITLAPIFISEPETVQ